MLKYIACKLLGRYYLFIHRILSLGPDSASQHQVLSLDSFGPSVINAKVWDGKLLIRLCTFVLRMMPSKRLSLHDRGQAHQKRQNSGTRPYGLSKDCGLDHASYVRRDNQGKKPTATQQLQPSTFTEQSSQSVPAPQSQMKNFFHGLMF